MYHSRYICCQSSCGDFAPLLVAMPSEYLREEPAMMRSYFPPRKTEHRSYIKGRVVRDGLASGNIKETVSKSSRNGHTSKTAEYSTNGN